MSTHFTIAPRRESSYLDSRDIISQLCEYQARNRSVKILNYYHEMPVTSFSKLLFTKHDIFRVLVSDMHLSVIRQQQQVIICLDDCDVLAGCIFDTPQDNALLVSGFCYVDLHAALREALRLNVDADLILDFRSERGRVAARLVDISITGCQVRIESDNISCGNLAVLEIKIFDEQQGKVLKRSIAARVVQVLSGEQDHLCGLEFLGSASDQDLLGRYLNQQQMALIKGLRNNKI